MEIIFLVIGVVIGGIAGWLLAAARGRTDAGAVAELRTQLEQARAASAALQSDLDAQRQLRVKAETQLAEVVKNLAQQQALLEDARAKLSDAFVALSSDALKSNNQAFLDLAKKTFDAALAEARGDLGKRQEAVDALIKPLAVSLERYEQHVKALEESRVRAYAGLQEQIKSLTGTQELLQKETGNLVTALRNPQVRGRWGELTLHRVVELAGMSEHCDFEEQVSVRGGDGGALRPDMIVHLPSSRDIVVDSKVSLEAYLRAVEAGNESQRADCIRQHTVQLREHMKALSGKQYWDQFDKAPEFVVMFIPGESFFAAALDVDATLLEDGMKQQVVLATPTTLIALLKAVAYGWRQEQMAENAQTICDLGRELYDRVRVLSTHVIGMGRALHKANEAYNNTVGSLELRVLPSIRKFQDLGVASGEPIPSAEPIDVQPRTLSTDVPATPASDA